VCIEEKATGGREQEDSKGKDWQKENRGKLASQEESSQASSASQSPVSVLIISTSPWQFLIMTYSLLDRLDALITLGYISVPSDVTRFAEGFVQKPEEEQALFLGQLDEEARRMSATGTQTGV
jgi:hypothetical protein